MFDKTLHNSEQAGVYFAPRTRHTKLADTAIRSLQPCRTVDLSACRDIEAVLQALGRDLAFPDYYGANLDALDECLSDPEWQAERDLLILISGLEQLRSGDPENFSRLIEVLSAAADSRKRAGIPCWIVLDTPARGISKLPSA